MVTLQLNMQANWKHHPYHYLKKNKCSILHKLIDSTSLLPRLEIYVLRTGSRY